jgi:hypothetical protein
MLDEREVTSPFNLKLVRTLMESLGIPQISIVQNGIAQNSIVQNGTPQDFIVQI